MEPDGASHNGIHRKERFVLSDLSFPSNSITDSLPCCVLHQQQNQSSVNNNTGSTLNGDTDADEGAPKVLSYASFGKCLDLHQEWLRDTIQNASTSVATDDNQSLLPPGSIDDIVIAYISGNCPDGLLSVLACTSSTLQPAIPALLNTRWTPSEMIHSLRSSGDNNDAKTPRRKVITIVLHDGRTLLENVARQVSNGLRQTRNHYSYCIAIPSYSRDYFEIVTRKPRHVNNNTSNFVRNRMEIISKMGSKSDALILFTSGTTGGSKGVRLSHRALLVQSLAKLDEPCGYSMATAMLATTVPLFHVGGLSSFLAVLLARGQLIFPVREGNNSSSFQVQDIPRSLLDSFIPANTLVVVPAMLVSFFASNNVRWQKQYLNTRLILIGGQSASTKTIQQIQHTFPNARIAQTYACTEAASSMTFLSLTNYSADRSNNSTFPTPILSGDCIGKPPSHIKIRIYNRDTNSAKKKHEPITKPYELGLIATYGPHVMNGYWKRGEQEKHTALNSIDDNQWFISSDLGFWDEQGRLCFGGRAKDVIRTGGETVLAQEVEKVLLQHPEVAECAVFPRKDDRYGEAVACALVAKQRRRHDGLALSTIKTWCQQKGLAGYKRPKFILFLDSLPRNSSGKVLKHKLTAQFGGNGIRSKL
mmetsp:Transcript_12556/g.26461  ORF Transcript_12556/g.26461 Transcript_12556/m.26461 type:complete len:646 (-) Transcript_12556:726-2663(-)